MLSGGVGPDELHGGLGDDFYFITEPGDLVFEAAGGGNDRIFASVSYILGAGRHVEMLTAIDAAATTAINLTGNEIANFIAGNAGNNILNGGGGADILSGLGGDDWYYVDHAGDVVAEAAGGGNDRIFASVSYILGAGRHVEMLTAVDAAATTAINLTGNEIANFVAGNAGNNILNGGGGADILSGLGGDDWYYVDHAGDVVAEAAGGGNDRIFASVSYVLGAGRHVEMITTVDAAATTAINLTGNELANAIYGNAGNNTLNGLGGSDTLSGGAGSDRFAFTAPLGAGNVDTIMGFQVGIDKIVLGGSLGEAFSLFAAGGLGSQHFLHVTSVRSPGVPVILYDPATAALLYDADGSLAGEPVQFATFSSPLVNFGANDFVVSGPPNSAPTITSGTTASVAENTPASTIVYQATAVDVDGDAVFWWTANPQVTIDQFGAVRLNAAPNFEVQSSYTFEIYARDSSDATTTRTVTLTVEDLSESTPVLTETTAPNDNFTSAQMIPRNELLVSPNANLPDDDLPSGTVTGSLTDPADRDYYSIYLEAGEVLYLDLDNTSGNLDAFLELFALSGESTVLLANDDLGVLDPGSDPHPEYGHNTDSFIRVRVFTSGTYVFAVSSFQDPERPTSGSYQLNVSIGPPATAAELWEEDVAALISGSEWDHTNLTYAFPTSTSQYPAGIEETDEPDEFAPFTAPQQAAVTAHLVSIAAVSGLTFSVAGDPATADLRFAMSSNADPAYAYYPTNQPDSVGGTAWFDKVNFNSPVEGGYAWMGILHEAGHALGLKHGHESPPISPGRDSLEFTVMTYRSYVGQNLDNDSGLTNEAFGFPQTLMMLDIAALQQMYGANFATNSGNSVYTWSPTTGEMSINGVGQGAPGANRIFMTLWDGGGTDTYDFSGYSNPLTIDLRPGEWTQTGSVQTVNLGQGNFARGNIANALLFDDDPRSLIENAIGGTGADTLIANQALNRLTGGPGADVFRWDSLADLMGPSPDVVTDFNLDYIDLSRLDSIPSTPERDGFSFIGTNAFGTVSGNALRWYTSGGNVVLQGDINGDTIADFEIMLLGISTLEHYQIYL